MIETKELRHMELLIVCYVPSMTSRRCLNVGVLVIERQEDRVSFADARFIDDMEKLLAFDPCADVEMLRSTFRDIEQKMADPEDRDAILRSIQNDFSNALQVSQKKGILVAGDPAVEVDQQVSLYLSDVPHS